MKNNVSFVHYATQKRFTIQEAAFLLCGFQPGSDLKTRARVNSVTAVIFSLCDSIESGHLFAEKYTAPVGGWWEATGVIGNTDIQRWAKARDFRWPPVEGVSNATPDEYYTLLSESGYWNGLLESFDKQLVEQNAPSQISTESAPAKDAQIAELKSQLEQAHKELARIKSEQEKANRSEVLHNTELLKLVHVVQERYWGANWDPSNNQTNTIQPVIIEWLMSTYSLSGFRAKAVEAVACPIDRNPVKKP